jgi:hypothetical protein
MLIKKSPSWLKLVTVLGIFGATAANANQTYVFEERADKYLCKYSDQVPSHGTFAGFEKRPLKRGMTPEKEMSVYRKDLGEKMTQNFNTLTANRMIHGYGFRYEEIQKALSNLDYHRNGFERYSFMRLMIRKKAENILLGINESLNYLDFDPALHPKIQKDKLGKVAGMFYDEQALEPQPAFLAIERVPRVCLNDSYVSNLVEKIKDTRREEYFQRNLNPTTGQLIFPKLPENEKIYSQQKFVAGKSFQVKLRNIYVDIQKFRELSKSIKGQLDRLTNFKEFLYSKQIFQQLASLSSEHTREEMIVDNPEYKDWANYIRIIFGNQEQREAVMRKKEDDQLAWALMELPNYTNLSKSDFDTAKKFLEGKIVEINEKIEVIKAMNPIITLDYNKGVGKTTLLSWLSSNPDEFKPVNVKSYSSNFNYEIQSALAHNFVYNQLPALERTCSLLKLEPKKLVCPENNEEIVNLISNEPIVDEVVHVEKHLFHSANDMMLDHYVTSAKKIKKSAVTTIATIAATAGFGAIVNTLSHSTKITALLNSMKAVRLANRTARLYKAYNVGKYVSEVGLIARTGLVTYGLIWNGKNFVDALGDLNKSTQDAYTSIESLPWGDQAAIKNSWRSVYMSAGFFALNAYFFKAQMKEFMSKSLIVKKGVAHVKTHHPKFVAWLRKRGVNIRTKSPVFKFVSNSRSRIGLIKEAFKRTITKRGNYIDAGSTKGELTAEVVTDTPQAGAIKTLRTADGKVIIKDGAFIGEGWERVTEGGKIAFKHLESGKTYSLSSRMFQMVNENAYGIRVSGNSVMFGISQGIRSQTRLTRLSGDSASVALGWRAVKLPFGVVYKFGKNMKSGVMLVFTSVAMSVTGVTLWLTATITKNVVDSAEFIKDVIPANWEWGNETLTQLITRLRPATINQVERQAQNREFTMQHHVRGVLDQFQVATNEIDGRLFQIQMTRMFYESMMKLASKEEDKERKKEHLAQAKQFVERMAYQVARFNAWYKEKLRILNYQAHWYTFYKENRILFDKYWDYYYQNRFENALPNNFSKEVTDNSCVLKFGPWVAAYPYSGEITDEMKQILDVVKSHNEAVKIFKGILRSQYGIEVADLSSDVIVEDVENESLENTNVEDFNAQLFFQKLSSAQKEITEKRDTLKRLRDSFFTMSEKLLDPMIDKFDKEEINKQVSELLKVIYQHRMREIYRWRFTTKDSIEVGLFQLNMLADKYRAAAIAKFEELSDFKGVIEETVVEGDRHMRVTYGLWTAETQRYEDTIEMKKLDIELAETMREIEQRIVSLHAKGVTFNVEEDSESKEIIQ